MQTRTPGDRTVRVARTGRLTLVAAATLVALGTTACGGSGRPGPTATPRHTTASPASATATPAAPSTAASTAGLPDPCALVTQAQADHILGSPTSVSTRQPTLCEYRSAPDLAHLPGDVSVTVDSGPAYDATALANRCLGGQSVSGLGDGACIIAAGNAILILKGTLFLGISITPVAPVGGAARNPDPSVLEYTAQTALVSVP